MKNTGKNKKKVSKPQPDAKTKGFYAQPPHEHMSTPQEEEHITVSRFISQVNTPRSMRQFKDYQLRDWPYQGDEGDDFLFGKIPDFFPDDFEEEE